MSFMVSELSSTPAFAGLLPPGRNVQVRLPVALHHVLRAHLSGQHVRQTGGTFNAQVVSNGRVAEISVDKQYFRTIFSKGHRSVDSHGGLAFRTAAQT